MCAVSWKLFTGINTAFSTRLPGAGTLSISERFPESAVPLMHLPLAASLQSTMELSVLLFRTDCSNRGVRQLHAVRNASEFCSRAIAIEKGLFRPHDACTGGSQGRFVQDRLGHGRSSFRSTAATRRHGRIDRGSGHPVSACPVSTNGWPGTRLQWILEHRWDHGNLAWLVPRLHIVTGDELRCGCILTRHASRPRTEATSPPVLPGSYIRGRSLNQLNQLTSLPGPSSNIHIKLPYSICSKRALLRT